MTAGEPDEDAMEHAIPATEPVAGRGENGGASATTGLVAGGITQRAGMAGTVDTAEALVAGVERSAPAARLAAAA